MDKYKLPRQSHENRKMTEDKTGKTSNGKIMQGLIDSDREC